MFYFNSFICSCSGFLAPLTEEAVFSSLYILASFVEDKVPIGVSVYLWAFYPVAFIYISVSVPIPCYFDDYSFIV